MSVKKDMGDILWSWVVKLTGLGVFVWSIALDKEDPSFAIALLALAAAILPINELRRLISTKWGGTPPPSVPPQSSTDEAKS